MMARRAVKDVSDRFLRSLDNLQLAVSELVTNAVRHARLEPTDEIRLVVREGQDRLRVEVTDPGRGRDAAVAGWSAIPDSYSFDSPAESSYGLFVVRAIAGRSGVVSDGAVVAWFEMDVAVSDPLAGGR